MGRNTAGNVFLLFLWLLTESMWLESGKASGPGSCDVHVLGQKSRNVRGAHLVLITKNHHSYICAKKRELFMLD